MQQDLFHTIYLFYTIIGIIMFIQSGFLQGITQILPSKKKKISASNKQSAALWLRLLASLTFATEGQQLVMKIPGESYT